MKHVVLDLETFGVAADSAVVSIGAVVLGDPTVAFYRVVKNPSGSVDPGSLRWWLDQREEVRAAIKGGQAESEVLVEFGQWLGGVREDADGLTDGVPLRLWGSEDFDTVILGAAYERNGLPRPWHYQEPRGLRTILEAAGVDEDALPWDGIEHIAIDCARHAAKALSIALATPAAPREEDAHA